MSFFDFPIYKIDLSAASDVIQAEGPHIYVSDTTYGDPEKGLLTKIMGAAKFDLTTLAVTQMQDDSNVKVFERGLKSDQLAISFGISTAQLGLNCDANPYRIINIESNSILFSHDLTTLSSNPDMKKALWGALKQFYNL